MLYWSGQFFHDFDEKLSNFVSKSWKNCPDQYNNWIFTNPAAVTVTKYLVMLGVDSSNQILKDISLSIWLEEFNCWY